MKQLKALAIFAVIGLTGCPSTTVCPTCPTCPALPTPITITAVPTVAVAPAAYVLMPGVPPGITGTFNVNPLSPALTAAALPLPFTPAWASSDPVNAPVTAAADGMSATVTVASSYAPAPDEQFTLTVSNPDGTGATALTVPYIEDGYTVYLLNGVTVPPAGSIPANPQSATVAAYLIYQQPN